jgi:uncharacterized protein (DUF305 family)
MKNFLLMAAVAGIMIACNNDKGNTSENTDTTHHGGMHGQMPGMDSSAAGGHSMVALMQKHMDQMRAMGTTGNPDNDFAAMMKQHHLGAIDMIQLELSKGTDAELKSMAQQMLDEQQREIAEFNSFLSGHEAHGGGDALHKEMMKQMNKMQMQMDSSGSIDKQFASMMISHHQGAIDMSKAYLKSGAHEEKLKTMANKIIADQQKEINDLQAWLK